MPQSSKSSAISRFGCFGNNSVPVWLTEPGGWSAHINIGYQYPWKLAVAQILEGRAADVNSRTAQLDAREKGLTHREAAVSAQEVSAQQGICSFNVFLPPTVSTLFFVTLHYGFFGVRRFHTRSQDKIAAAAVTRAQTSFCVVASHLSCICLTCAHRMWHAWIEDACGCLDLRFGWTKRLPTGRWNSYVQAPLGTYIVFLRQLVEWLVSQSAFHAYICMRTPHAFACQEVCRAHFLCPILWGW